MAHAMLRHACRLQGLSRRVRVESAGTHVAGAGARPDARVLTILDKHGINAARLRSRPFAVGDFQRFDQILVMDQGHLSWLEALQERESQGPGTQPRMVMEFSEHYSETEVPDPYYANTAAFDFVFERLTDACGGIMKQDVLPRFARD